MFRENMFRENMHPPRKNPRPISIEVECSCELSHAMGVLATNMLVRLRTTNLLLMSVEPAHVGSACATPSVSLLRPLRIPSSLLHRISSLVLASCSAPSPLSYSSLVLGVFPALHLQQGLIVLSITVLGLIDNRLMLPFLCPTSSRT